MAIATSFQQKSYLLRKCWVYVFFKQLLHMQYKEAYYYSKEDRSYITCILYKVFQANLLWPTRNHLIY